MSDKIYWLNVKTTVDRFICGYGFEKVKGCLTITNISESFFLPAEPYDVFGSAIATSARLVSFYEYAQKNL